MGAEHLKVTLVRNRFAEGALGTGAKLVAQHPRCHGVVDEGGVQHEHVCGRMYLDERDRFVGVAGVGVDYYAQRRGLGFQVGTKLYERAAQIACDVGKPLASDRRRSTLAEGFWQKQAAKGRAHYDADENRYFLSCPAPSLGRARRGRP